MRDYANDIRLRESEMESMRIAFNEDLAKKEREKTQLKHRLEEANQRINSLEKDQANFRQQEEQRDTEVNRLRDDFEQRINEYEDTLNAKIRENQVVNVNLRDTQAKLEKLEKDLLQQKATSVSQTRIKMLNPTLIQKPGNVVQIRPVGAGEDPNEQNKILRPIKIIQKQQLLIKNSA